MAPFCAAPSFPSSLAPYLNPIPDGLAQSPAQRKQNPTTGTESGEGAESQEPRARRPPSRMLKPSVRRCEPGGREVGAGTQTPAKRHLTKVPSPDPCLLVQSFPALPTVVQGHRLLASGVGLQPHSPRHGAGMQASAHAQRGPLGHFLQPVNSSNTHRNNSLPSGAAKRWNGTWERKARELGNPWLKTRSPVGTAPG